MRLSVNEIVQSNDYKYYYKFKQSEGKLFLNENIKKISIITYSYYLFVIATVTALLFFVFLNVSRLEFVMGELGMAIILFFPSMVIHELIHAIVSIFLGARTVKLGFEKGLIVTKINNFVISNIEYIIIAITPLLTIILITLLVLLITKGNLISGIIFLLLHLWCSYGDIAIVNYCWLNRKNNIYGFSSEDGFFYFYSKQRYGQL